LWSLPLIVLTVLVHGFGLVEICEHVVGQLTSSFGAKSSRAGFAAVIAATVLLVTGLHALEGGAWAFAYVALGASPDFRIAVLLFAKRDDELRTCRDLPGPALAVDGCARGVERHDAVRPDDCVPVFRAIEALAGHAHDGR
jgi:hypothetical protein